MKIYHIQAGISPAGNAAYRLHQSMLKNGIDSNIITLASSKKFNKVKVIKDSIVLKLINMLRLKIKLRHKKPNTYLFNILSSIGNKQVSNIVKDADAIYIHWIGGYFLSMYDLERIAQINVPVVFFLHDMWALTGGCHHSFSCNKYINGCHHCDMFTGNDKLAEKQARKKYDFFHKYKNIHIVTPSKWEEKCARESYILKNMDIRYIPNLVDENEFKPVSKSICRNLLNLPQDKYIISFGCQTGTKNTAKGWSFLRDALNKLNLSNVHLIIFGTDYDKQTADELKYPITFMGQKFDETSLVLMANAADLYVSPSLAESYGLTFVEYSLCNTPVVGFDCTAIPESVIPNVNGYLAKHKNTEDLAKCIEKAYAEKMEVTFRNNYSSKSILQKHLDLLNEK